MKKTSILLATLCVATVSCISEADFSASENAETTISGVLQTKITGSTQGEHQTGCILLCLD